MTSCRYSDVKSLFSAWQKGALLGGCLFILSFSALSHASSYVTIQGQPDDFAVFHGENTANIVIDPNEPQGVHLAVANLQNDLQKVTGHKPDILHHATTDHPMIIVGTLQNSAILQSLEQQGKIDLAPLREHWEAFSIELVNNPMPGVEQALVLAGNDKRGAIFAIYDVAENIGVSPWSWWADVPVAQQQQLYIKAHTRIVDWPKVQYRGIFLNDEAPALTGWVQEKFGDYNSQFYQKVFELILRLKGNFLWPAMWNNAFNLDDPNNPILADKMGIVMSTSHHEPMMRADKEWDRVGTGKWDYSVNQKNLYDFWMHGAKRHKNLESMFTLGMRGQQDEPMSEDQNIELLERIVADQRQIISQVFAGQDIAKVPQVWTLYKEVQGYYDNGMRVPDDVTLLWSDDNWGNLRRLPTPEERLRKGGAGVYYHFDYVGGPRSYRWINTLPIAKIWEQMNLAYEYDARKIWITNVGDLKPMELPIDFFMTMAWDPEAMDAETLPKYLVNFARQQFGSQHAEQIAQLLHAYTRHNGRRKPELMGPDTYSQIVYQEAQRVATELSEYVDQAERLYTQIAENQQPAFFQLVLYPLKASYIVFQLNNNLAKNHLFARQERATANHYAQQVKDWFAADAALTKQYHDLNDGKWNHFMSQPHIGYSNWNNPPANTLPVVHINQPNAVADMGVAIQGSAYAWPQASSNVWPHSSELTLAFDRYGQSRRFVDIFNKGTVPFEFTIRSSEKWISLSQSSGKVDETTRVWVSIDWQQVKAGDNHGEIEINGAAWGSAKVQVSAFLPETVPDNGFVEADGYISIEAGSFSRLKNAGSSKWREIPMHGRTHSSMSAFMPPDSHFAKQVAKAPYLEYDLYLFDHGEFDLHTLLAPSLNFIDGQGLRFAIAVDDQAPKVIDMLAGATHGDWQKAVADGVRTVTSTISIATPGPHTLRVYAIDPGIVIQKLIIDTGGLKPSYLGPEQSPLASGD